MNRSSVVLVAALGGACSAPGEPAQRATDALSGRPSVAFETRTVPVCWESTSEFAAERELVRLSVAHTWEGVDGGLIHFVGWGQCAPDDDAIRIEVAPKKRAYARAFGRRLLGMEGGLILNFTFGPEYAQDCAADERTRISCIAVDAVHEFGHVLGFSHEQNRADRPADSGCTSLQLESGADDPTTVAETTFNTMYDRASVMNYCNPAYWNRAAPEFVRFDKTRSWPLSAADVAGMRAMYGGASAASCPSGDGLYCGGEAGIGGADGTLYRCASGEVSIEAVCAGGCEQMPAGTSDRCAP